MSRRTKTVDQDTKTVTGKARDNVHAPRTAGEQPINACRWVDRNALLANHYNPNHVPPRELELLRISILADGWTQPIVARHTGNCEGDTTNGDITVHDPGQDPPDEIVDGFHRWTVAGDPEISALTGGLVPVVFIPENTPLDHQMMSTIRHNRARGNHRVVAMADIVISLANDHNLDRQAIAELMQMEAEEVDRFLSRGSMIARYEREGRERDFSHGWTVTED